MERILLILATGISLSSQTHHDAQEVSFDDTLRLLSIVETDRVPLYLHTGLKYDVAINKDETDAYFRSILLPNADLNQTDTSPWWQSARTDSPLGILVACNATARRLGRVANPRITELLIFASREHFRGNQRALTPPRSSPDACGEKRESSSVKIYALPLSSDLIRPNLVHNPDFPGSATEPEPTFLPCHNGATALSEVINVPPVRKRKSLNETLDEAAERRRKARRTGGEGVAAAAASNAHTETFPALIHRRNISTGHAVTLQARPLSRASSAASGHNNSAAREASAPGPAKRLSLARTKSISEVPQPAAESVLEAKNKELISRSVMAGMRLYGYVQSKSRRSLANSAGADSTAYRHQEECREQDEAYKLLYHQVYKGTCFAFRSHVARSTLLGHSEKLRETVDQLLAIFCHDPLSNGLDSLDDKLTPGGRHAFGSADAPRVKLDPFEAMVMPSPSIVKYPVRDAG